MSHENIDAAAEIHLKKKQKKDAELPEAVLPDLPDDIISDIFSYCIFSPDLTNKQAINVGLSTKANFRLVQNLPSLRFDGCKTELSVDGMYNKELDYLHKTLRRYNDENIHLETFTFKFRGYDPDFKKTGYECINLATRRSLKSLSLSAHAEIAVPVSVYVMESLEQLSLTGWKLTIPDGGIVWPNLKRLCLHSVNRGVDDFLHEAGKSCPSVETLEIYRCCYYNSCYKFSVSSFPNLKQLTVQFRYNTQGISLGRLPSLKSLTLSYESHDGSYSGRGSITLNFPGELFPRLEELYLNAYEFHKISLSSPTLKKIRLENMPSLREAKFEVPNILLFECQEKPSPKLSFTGNSRPGGWISHINSGSDRQRFQCGAEWSWPIKKVSESYDLW